MDTIILKIYGPNKFQPQKMEWFSPELKRRDYEELSPTEKKSTRPYLRRFVLHPPFHEKYVPNVELFETLTKDRKALRWVLQIKFSLQKLLFSNSVLETGAVEKNEVFDILSASLKSIGIHIDAKNLADARVGAVHFCKNILLPRHIRMQEILDELIRLDINKTVDVDYKEHKNGGRVLNFYSGTIERSIYDKTSDAMRPRNKRKDKAFIVFERDFIKSYGLQNREIFRYEYRLKKTQTVMRELNPLLGREPKTAIAFKDLFIADIPKKIMLKSWASLIQRPENQLALIGPKDKLGSMLHIFKEAKKRKTQHSMNNALISYGLMRAIQDFSVKEVRKAIFETWNTDHPERLTEKMKTAANLTAGLPYSNSIAFIDSALQAFELITLTFLENGI